ncbi:MAG: hypothetical protein GY771_03970 [bacterium]|nr:hypothetical protein [bacterium]
MPKKKKTDLSGFPDETVAAITKYRDNSEKVTAMKYGGTVFKVGVAVVIALSVFFIVIYPFTRYPLWPALLLVAMAALFWFLSRWYKKEAITAQAEATVAELELREIADRALSSERERILSAAGVPITMTELDRLRPTDFE